MRRQTGMFRDTAVESLTLSIELFNRPSTVAREHAVIMMLAHSFEMLLKAAIFERRGTVRDKGAELSHSLKRCIAIAVNELMLVTEDDRTLLAAIKQDRDCATHDTISMSEEMLWLHMRGGITIFNRVLQQAFAQSLDELLPNRVIPVSVSPPEDLGFLVEAEVKAVLMLLAPKTRKTAEARARLRPLLSLDGASTGRLDQPTETEVNRAEKALKTGTTWESVLPGLAALQIAPVAPGANVQELALRMSREADGVPVRRAAPGESALVYRDSNPFDDFGVTLSTFGRKLSLTQFEGFALIHYLDLKNDDRAYFIRRTPKGAVKFQGLSARALELAKQEMSKPEFDLDNVKRTYSQRHKS